jgi:hypothetical protein
MPIDKVRVMISSRCKDYATAGGASFPLQALRQRLKKRIDAEAVFGERTFQCFTNEHEPAKAATNDVWEACLREIRRSHIVIALYNGDAGWSSELSDDGICHAELNEALYSGRGRTYVVQLPLTAKAADARDRRFRERFDKELQFTGPPAATEDAAFELVLQTLAEATADLARSGAGVIRKESYSLGEALDWSRLDFAKRKQHMEDACREALLDRSPPASGTAASGPADGRHAVVSVGGADILFCVHAIPAATSLAAARELVGRPFLIDHEHLRAAPEAHGPVHVIACHRSATEKQATDLLGFPDATVVATSFGIYVLDPVQRIQIVLLANCRDRTTTRYAVQRLFDWLDRSDQEEPMVAHAGSRGRIVRAIQQEVDGAGTTEASARPARAAKATRGPAAKKG